MAAIHRRGWCDGTGGNFSCVLQRQPLLLLMAPSGVDKGAVAPEAMITVDGAAQVVAGQGKASAETLLHLEIVARTGAGAVLHTHSQAGTLLSQWVGGGWAPNPDPALPISQPTQQPWPPSQRWPAAQPSDATAAIETETINYLEISGLEMLKGLPGITSHQSRIRIPVLANDQNLRRLSAAASPLLASAPNGLLIAGHGLYAWGLDLEQANRHLEILEFLMEQRWRQLLLEALLGRGLPPAAAISQP
jgi:methylthioribulose-1-phosphate dehydratase